MEGTFIRKIGLSILLIMLLYGCVENISGTHIYNKTREDAKKAEEVFASDDRLRSAFVVFHENDVITGVTVGTFSRFHKEKIEKELKEKLEEKYPDADILVSADSKIVMETRELAEAKNDKELAKKIKHLKSHSKEET